MEFISLAMCVREVLWVKKFPKSFNGILGKVTALNLFAISIGEDNPFCISDAFNSTLSELSKHVDLKCQFLVDHIKKKDVG